MFIKDGLRYNPQFPLVIDGTTYASFDQLRAFPEVLAKGGISEANVLVPEYNQDESILNEIDPAPYYVLTPRDPEQVVRTKQQNINTKALAYLASTDWYVERFAETGKAIPDDIKAARQTARDSIVKLESLI